MISLAAFSVGLCVDTKLEGGFDGVGEAVVAVGAGELPAARACDGLQVFRGVVHEDGAAGGLKHGDVVPVVADGEYLRGINAAGVGQGHQRGAFGTTRGKYVEDRKVARGVFRAVEGEEVIVFVWNVGIIASHPAR